jgi:Family of unknown function (DUF6286)
MTFTSWLTRVVCALLALALLVGSLLALIEIAAAALDRAPVLVPHREWTSWLRAHDWDEWIVSAVMVGLVVLGLLFLLLAIRRGKPASLALKGRTDGVSVVASRRSVEKALASAAARTTGITGASASVKRRAARVDASTLARSESQVREKVETAVRARLDSLGLERPLRTRVDLTARDTR